MIPRSTHFDRDIVALFRDIIAIIGIGTNRIICHCVFVRAIDRYLDLGIIDGDFCPVERVQFTVVSTVLGEDYGRIVIDSERTGKSH